MTAINAWALQAGQIGNDAFPPPPETFGQERVAGLGHEERLLPSRLNGCCRFGQGTFAGTQGNGEVASKAAIRPIPAAQKL